MTQSIARGAEARVYWTASDLAEGLTGIVCSARTDTGSVLAVDAPLAELGNGVYAVDLGVVDDDCHVLAIVSSLVSAAEGSVLVVGDPATKLWYVDGPLRDGLVLSWSLLDRDAVLVAAGVLDDEGGGFYSTAVPDVPDGEYLLKTADEVNPIELPVSSGTTVVVETRVSSLSNDLLGGGVASSHPLFSERGFASSSRRPRVTASLREETSVEDWWDFARGAPKRSASLDEEDDPRGSVTAVIVETN